MPHRPPARERLIAAARKLFGEQGYARSTTRAIAAEAGVTEVTLFRHFGTKQNLFRSLVQQQALEPMFARMEAMMSDDYAADMLLLGRIFQRVMKERHAQVRMMLCEAGQFPEVAEVMAENPRRMRAFLAEYLARQQAAGRVRSGHVQALAQAFWGMFFAWGIAQGTLSQALEPPISDDDLVRSFVDAFVAGTAASEEGA